MWYIILCYIVIFKLPVSANAFQFHSVADMTNIYRSNVMQPISRGRLPPAQGQVMSNYQLTTCIEGGYDGRVCNRVQRPIMHARQGMINPQVMLPKHSGLLPLTNPNPQNKARTPRQLMMRPLIRASVHPTQNVKHELPYHANERNRDYRDYQMFPQATNPSNGNKDPQEYPPLPQTTKVDTGNHREYNAFLPQAANLDSDKYKDDQFLPQATHADYQNRDQQEKLEYTIPAHSYLDLQEYELSLVDPRRSTSTAAPIRVSRSDRDTGSKVILDTPKLSTTSTIPPYPGGLIPSGHPDAAPKVCGDKAKCKPFIWTTKRYRTIKSRTTEFTIWNT